MSQKLNHEKLNTKKRGVQHIQHKLSRDPLSTTELEICLKMRASIRDRRFYNPPTSISKNRIRFLWGRAFGSQPLQSPNIHTGKGSEAPV